MELVTKEPNRNSCTESRTLWRKDFSLGDIAEHVERIAQEKQDLERQLAEAMEERNALNLRCVQSDMEWTSERTRLGSEILELRKQLDDSLSAKKTDGGGRQRAELAAKEKLIRDEFERKVQDLQVELKRERHQLAKRMEMIKKQQTGCICQPTAVRAIKTTY